MRRLGLRQTTQLDAVLVTKLGIPRHRFKPRVFLNNFALKTF